MEISEHENERNEYLKPHGVGVVASLDQLQPDPEAHGSSDERMLRFDAVNVYGTEFGYMTAYPAKDCTIKVRQFDPKGELFLDIEDKHGSLVATVLFHSDELTARIIRDMQG
ncbi:MAG: hypothetical protein LUE27_02410 [Clostridia bacterium]|nr:hypothetical protein [Clostridia bacterium]